MALCLKKGIRTTFTSKQFIARCAVASESADLFMYSLLIEHAPTHVHMQYRLSMPQV